MAAPEKQETQPYLFVLDLDRLIIDEKAKIYEGTDPKEYLKLTGGHARLAAYTPEFLAALKFYFSKVLGAPVEIAIFSGGTKARNEEVVGALHLTEHLRFKDIITEIKSFEDLTVIKEFEGQEGVPFFKRYKKDLNIFGVALERVIIFDEKLHRDTLATTAHWVPDGEHNPIQIARAKYRLVRAVGILSKAIEWMKVMGNISLPDAVQTMQWMPNGKYRSRWVNDEEKFYYEGMSILETVHTLYLKKTGTTFTRAPDYFTFNPLVPRREDCDAYLESKDGVLPWQK